MKRREFLKTAGYGAAGLALTGRLAAAGAEGQRPNIIFIMADDLGYADCGCYGQRLIRTPEIDRMAREGTRFTQCYSGAAVCAPARSVLMTGQHTGHTRIRENAPNEGGQPEAFGEGTKRLSLEAEDITVGEVLKQAGYATGVTGKWGIGEPGTEGIPNKQGFDEWLGFLNQNHAPYYYTDYLWHNETKMEITENRHGRREVYAHDLLTDFALDFIKEHKDEPFFLYIPYTIPHKQFEVPDTAPYTDEPWPELAKVYAAMITRMDRDVGRIFDQLKTSGIDENTIVFFCSDNGENRKDWGDLFNSTGQFRGKKSDLYEGGIRTPMIVRWPGKVAANAVNKEAVWYFADFLPTAADIANAKLPDNIDGISVLPTILGKEQNTADRFLYWEFPRDTLWQAVRWRNWKAIRFGIDAELELYDLSKDESEQYNVASQYPEVVAAIEEYLKTARTESPNWPTELLGTYEDD